ncbi:MAG: S8 family serine peptidase [Gemmatimonadota bacterium]|nr:S8 family serine peptidase [Gemmatimonadota bacterium]
MADFSRSRTRAIVVAAVFIGANACSSDSSTGGASRSIIGHVTINPGEARIPAENFVGGHRTPLTPLVLRREKGAERINVIFHSEALGNGRVGALSVRTNARAREVGTAIRARLAAQPAASKFTVSDVSPTIGAAQLRLRDASQRDAVLAALRADPAVAYAGIDHMVSRGPESRKKLTQAMIQQIRDVRASTTPGAEGLRFANAFSSRIQYWNYNLIDAPRAWAIPDTGSATVTVAVIDDGINLHPDIATNLDMAGGYDFVSDDTDEFGGPAPRCGGGPDITNRDADGTLGPDPDPTMPIAIAFDAANGCYQVEDIANHGLHVSGTIGATNSPTNNVTGVNFNVRIRMIRALGIDGGGFDFDVAQAVLYAAGLPAEGAGGNPVTAPNRAPIINMSLGGTFDDSTLRTAVAAAINAGSVIIASAGNDASFNPSYPASYPDVISVAALGADGQLASYSSTNAFVSLVAPGGDFRFDDPMNPSSGGTSGVLSTVWDFNPPAGFDWAFYTGTSMAAPHVSGVAALVLAANPGLSGAQLRARLTSTAVDMGPPGFDTRYGFGRVDAFNAVTGTQGPTMKIYVSAINATTGAVVKTVAADADNSYKLDGLDAGTYYVVAGQDENDDRVIGFPGRRYGWANGGLVPTPVTVGSSGTVDASIPIGVPTQQLGVTGRVFVNSWVYGNSATPTTLNTYDVTIPTSGVYTFETSGAIGSCGFALELNTFITVKNAAGDLVGSNDNTSSATGKMTFPGSRCSYVSATLNPGTYTVVVQGGGDPLLGPLFNPGTFRLHVRSGV